MGFNSWTKIYVTNATSQPAKIWFSHQYSSDSVQRWPSEGSAPLINPGSKAGPLTAYYNTGFMYTGQDYWFCAIQIQNAPQLLATEGTWEDPKKQCTFTHYDNHQTDYFQVNTTTFTMAERGPNGSCTTPVSAGNGAALVAVKSAAKQSAA